MAAGFTVVWMDEDARMIAGFDVWEDAVNAAIGRPLRAIVQEDGRTVAVTTAGGELRILPAYSFHSHDPRAEQD